MNRNHLVAGAISAATLAFTYFGLVRPEAQKREALENAILNQATAARLQDCQSALEEAGYDLARFERAGGYVRHLYLPGIGTAVFFYARFADRERPSSLVSCEVPLVPNFQVEIVDEAAERD